jgi:hypothetical protein
LEKLPVVGGIECEGVQASCVLDCSAIAMGEVWAFFATASTQRSWQIDYRLGNHCP